MSKRSSYVWSMATHLEDVADCFSFPHLPQYGNEEIATRASELRWDIIKFLEKVESNENDN